MSKALENNNPGNLRYNGQQGAVNNGGYAKFASPDDGYVALMNDIHSKVTGATSTGLSGTSTLSDFASKYAPLSENDSDQYTLNLANHLKVSPDTKLSDLQDRVPEMADAIAHNEDKDFVSKYKLNVPSVAPQQEEVKYTPQTPQNAPQAQETQQPDQTLGGQLQGRLGQISQSLADTTSGKINPVSGTLQTVGGLAGGASDVIQKGVELIPGVKSVEGLIGQGVGKLAGTETGKGLIGKYQQFAQEHPELAGDISAAGNIASLVPMVKGIGLAKGAITGTLGKIAGKEALESVISDISPELSATGKANVIAKGGTTKSLVKGIISPTVDTETKAIADTVNQSIPNFSKLSTFSDKVNAVQDALNNEAEQLKQQIIASGKNRLYPFKELASKISSVEEPISLKGTPFEKQIGPLKEAALQIAQKNGGNISGLFDTRKEFDALVNRTYPNLWDKENAPMRNAITSVRNTMNDFIEKSLPKELGYKSSLQKQTRFYSAIDNLAPKAAKELGTTRLGRLMKKHPVVSGLIKGGAEAALGGAGALGAYNAYQGLTGNK